MKKMIKLVALMLMLVLAVTMVCGCATGVTKDDEEDEKVFAELTIGLPYGADSEIADDIKAMIGSIAAEDGFSYLEDTIVTIVTVPEVGTEKYDEFIKKVKSGKIDMFLSYNTEHLEELVEEKKIADLAAITYKDGRFEETLIPSFKILSRELDRLPYSVPFNGTYQGLFINTDMFEQAEVPVPTDWASLKAAIPALIEKDVVPFAAGFADGAGYWLDEMILSEGGVAEHSALPSKGVINSWSRAVGNIKSFYDMGAFQSNALTNTHDVAVQQFLNKETAMIVCSSKDIATGLDTNTVTYMSMPKTDTGIKEDGAFIAETGLRFYIYTKSLNTNVDETTSLSSKMYEFILEYMSGSDYYPELFDEPGYFPFNTAAEAAMDTDMEQKAWQMLSSAEKADIPLKNYLLAYGELESGLIEVLDGRTTINDYLTAVTEAEIQAQAEKKELEKEKK